MGNWGYDLYENDVSLDVKDSFEKYYNREKDVFKITNEILEDFKDVIDHPYEAKLFWYALADVQWDYGVLLPNVKEKAVDLIKEEISSIKANAQWIKTVEKLNAKLASPLPQPKRVRKSRKFTCQWKKGDVFAFKIEGDISKEKGLFGKYLLIQKIDNKMWDSGNIVPIVYVKLTKEAKLPTNLEEYNKLEYVQVGFTKYENRFLPVNMERLEEDIAEKSKLNYEVDEYGYLPEFRISLLFTSKKQIPEKLIYVGNFDGSVLPSVEFVPHANVNVKYIFGRAFEETFEDTIIKCYCGHNLRELSIYKDKKADGTVDKEHWSIF